MSAASPGAPTAPTVSPAVTADPTLLQLARGGSRWAIVGFFVLTIAALVAVLSVTIFRPGKPKGGAANVTVQGNPAFRIDYARGVLKSRPAGPGGVELVDRDPDDSSGSSRLLVTPQELPAYKGSPTGALPLASVEAQTTIAARFDPGATRFIEEGLVNVGPNPGYQLSYVSKRDGATWYGRAAVVVPDVDGHTAALLMDGQEERVADDPRGVKGPRAVGRQGDLARSMKSLVFLD